MYAVIFASGKHSRLLLAYGNSKPPLSGNQGNFEIDEARRGGGGGALCTLQEFVHGIFYSKGDY